MSAWLPIFTLDLGVVALAAFVLLLDAFVRLPGRALGFLVALGLAGLLIASFFLPLSGQAPGGVYISGAWSLFFKRMLLVTAILGVLGVMDWLEKYTPRRRAEYYALTLFSLSGMMVLPGVRDWVLMLVAFEVMGVPLTVLAAWAKLDSPRILPGEPRLSAEAGLKLFVTSAASSGISFFGVALVTGLTATTHLAGLGTAPVTPLLAVGMLMIVAGFGFKVGAVPFHFWIPDTYEGAPTPFVAFLSVAPKLGGLAALTVVLVAGWGRQTEIWGPAIVLIAAANMIVGNVLALPQQDARRLLAFSGIAQIGYVLIAVRAGANAQAIAMLLFFLVAYLFTNLGAFFIVHAAAEESEGHTIAKLAGLSRRSPALGAALLVFLLSLAGIPFVAGFWAKVFIFLAAWRAGYVWLAALGAAIAVVGLFYYLTVARSTYMSDGTRTAPIKVGAPLGAAIAVCLIAVVGLGLWPGPLLKGAEEAAASFLAGK